MSRRIRRILLVCNNYDNFSLEEDGSLDMRISREYSELNLTNPPVFERVETTAEALELVAGGERFDLVITMYNVGEVDVFEFSRKMKQSNPDTPIVLLTPYSKEVWRKMQDRDRSSIDYAFCWSGSTDLIIAIIKLLEDRMNADDDILQGSVQCILLVEDSVRYYSSYLTLLYKLVLQQNIAALKDALNEEQQISRKRSRPKILMATNYDDAVSLYNTYKENLLGVLHRRLNELHEVDVLGIAAGALGHLKDQGSLEVDGGLGDALDDLHVVDVERADGVAAVVRFLEHFGSRYDSHKSYSFSKNVWNDWYNMVSLGYCITNPRGYARGSSGGNHLFFQRFRPRKRRTPISGVFRGAAAPRFRARRRERILICFSRRHARREKLLLTGQNPQGSDLLEGISICPRTSRR